MSSSPCDCLAPSSITSIRELFNNAKEAGDFLKICAPMVRYSQLPFRLLTRQYGCDIAFSPMIVASAFAASEKARLVDFSSCPADRPLVVQFGTTNTDDLVNAAAHVVRIADGVDVNCGCPQKWAIKEGLGSALLQNPELVKDMVTRMKNAYPSGQLDHEVTISIKIRIFSDVRRSVDFAQQMSRTGLDFMTIHGRTVAERSNDPPHWNIVSTVNECALRPAGIPLVVNGAIRNLEDATSVVKLTGAQGVMAAENLLRNPAMFDKRNYSSTPPEVFKDFLGYAKCVPSLDVEGDKGHHLKFEVFKKHISEMLSGYGFGRRNKKVKEYHSRVLNGDEAVEWLEKNILNTAALPPFEEDDFAESCDPSHDIVSPSL